jgi:hypothetical protein
VNSIFNRLVKAKAKQIRDTKALLEWEEAHSQSSYVCTDGVKKAKTSSPTASLMPTLPSFHTFSNMPLVIQPLITQPQRPPRSENLPWTSEYYVSMADPSAHASPVSIKQNTTSFVEALNKKLDSQYRKQRDEHEYEHDPRPYPEERVPLPVSSPTGSRSRSLSEDEVHVATALASLTQPRITREFKHALLPEISSCC